MDSICLLQLSSCITSLLTLCFPVVNCSKLNFSYSAHLQATEVEALILLSPRRGIQHYFYEEDFKLKTPELKYDPLRKELSHRRPEQVQGNLSWQQSCFGMLQHLISLCASRSVSDHSFKGLWGKVLPAVHTYLWISELPTWTFRWKQLLLCCRSGNLSEAEEKRSSSKQLMQDTSSMHW